MERYACSEMLDFEAFPLNQARSTLSTWCNDYNDHRPHSGLGWLTPAEFAQTVNPRRDAVLRSRNGSAPQPAATARIQQHKTAGANSNWIKLGGKVRRSSAHLKCSPPR
jgi:putative transposase